MEKCFSLSLVVLLVDVCLGQTLSETLTNKLLLLKINELEKRVEGLKSELAQIQYDQGPLTAQKRSQDKFKTRSIGVGDVAFYAQVMTDKILTHGKTLLFENVKTNDGNAYSPTTGIFTCPVSGVYDLSLNIACDPGNFVEVSIQKNEQEPLLESICKNPMSSGMVHQNGGSAVVKLNKGDKIFVQMVWPAHVIATVKGRGMSTFSGFLLHT